VRRCRQFRLIVSPEDAISTTISSHLARRLIPQSAEAFDTKLDDFSFGEVERMKLRWIRE
jgi:hypothetical protein